jgi:hypothetical protein
LTQSLCFGEHVLTTKLFSSFCFRYIFNYNKVLLLLFNDAVSSSGYIAKK